MSTRHVCGVLAAFLLSSTGAFAQHDEVVPTGEPYQTPFVATDGDGDSMRIEETPITLIGCLQQESDYRHNHDRGDGRFGGAGMDDEFILINAFRIMGSVAPEYTDIDCSVESVGEAYELTGELEHSLEGWAGRRVEISGTLKETKVEPVGTAGVRPKSGSGGELRLFEINVGSFREPVYSQVRIERVPVPMVEVRPEPAPEPQGTTGELPVVKELPRTASPLPIAGLVTLMLLCSALGVHVLRLRRG